MFKFEVCGKKVFKLLKASCFMCQKEFFAIVTSFKWNFKFVSESFSSGLRASCKGFLLWHIMIEWERFEMTSSKISKFFNFKFPHLQFFWIKRHRMFVLALVFNKMSSFQMESWKSWKSLMVATFTFRSSRYAWCFQSMGFGSLLMVMQWFLMMKMK